MAIHHIAVVVGTRPEAIKLAPVIIALRAAPWVRITVVGTAQHRELLDQALTEFGIAIDVDLNVMTADQTLSRLTSTLITRLDRCLSDLNPALVLGQGDTTTVFATALVCFYHGRTFGHVEGGLRSFNINLPFPEEFNRIAVSRIAAYNFVPTETARQNLLHEGVSPDRIFLTGNTVIDSLFETLGQDRHATDPIAEETILLTAHRRENFGEPLARICHAVQSLISRFPNLRVVFPVHPNPNVQAQVWQMLGDIPRVALLPPLSYSQMALSLQRCKLVLTDSGGLQEEAPALGKPVLVLRTETERPEAIELGVAKLVGSDRDIIIDEVSQLLSSPNAYRAMVRRHSPYGDGRASERIVKVLAHFLENSAETWSEFQPA